MKRRAWSGSVKEAKWRHETKKEEEIRVDSGRGPRAKKKVLEIGTLLRVEPRRSHRYLRPSRALDDRNLLRIQVHRSCRIHARRALDRK